ncbi:MAG: GNAT family N-acetyltransferase [Methanospirillum sp.]|nr:GNAT family N-acetyltransferase [Methanospirillum sp.]
MSPRFRPSDREHANLILYIILYQDCPMAYIAIVDMTPENIADYGVCGYKDLQKHEELRRKIAWFSLNYSLGLRIKALISEKDGYQGMVEYMPGEIAHRPVDAGGYLFIQCIFTGLKKEYKGKGYGEMLIRSCIQEAEQGEFKGVAVVTRNGSFMAKKDIFLKLGFIVVDSAPPDFDLLALRFSHETPAPWFTLGLASRAAEYPEGLTILSQPSVHTR